LVADGKGILAADETAPTLTKRFDILGIASTEQSRRTYREMLFTSPGAADFISGAIMYDETIRQKTSDGMPFAKELESQGMLPGIKVNSLPSAACVSANAHGLARYASLCQEQDLVPIVEPEVLMEGSHFIGRCEQVTSVVLHAVFDALFEQGVLLEAMLLKPNMVIAGKQCAQQASVEEVADATLTCLRRYVPAAVSGIVFLSGGQSARLATAHLNAINRIGSRKPWKISFSYGRALQDPALEAWHGRDEYLAAGQRAFCHRACLNGAATLGKYTCEMEASSASEDETPLGRDWHDD
jgi:fructose-bisphosphate aldolase, class I